MRIVRRKTIHTYCWHHQKSLALCVDMLFVRQGGNHSFAHRYMIHIGRVVTCATSPTQMFNRVSVLVQMRVLTVCVVVFRVGSVCCFSCWIRALCFVLVPCVVVRVDSVFCFSCWLFSMLTVCGVCMLCFVLFVCFDGVKCV